ncbi:hypothetical protein [Microtetraspora sp. NBRC 13810]|uniref:hypothetical protein n=1 Tax=Microtetraspora sp. NBRC 13810 TaxID=3030990 RepID=UPI0025554540|nr:hypothetical protein [Microtetraspora sp. NBRC 13810]
MVTKVGDTPLRVIYGIGATLITALIVFLIFVFFSGDEPRGETGMGATAGTAAVAAAPLHPRDDVPPTR